jgi:TetR/AcrR family fatty acid metabolism transcriptional regulator
MPPTSKTKTRQAKRRPAAKRRPQRSSPAPDERKKQILKAAVEVFAERGYHGCRISDVADRAGVAYGLVYHYFGNKEALLDTIFQANWAVFGKALEDVASQDAPCQEKIRQIVEFLLNAFELHPLVVKVLVVEFGRNYRVGDALDSPEVARVFRALYSILEEARNNGELQEGLDPHALAIILLGSMEAALSSFVLPAPGATGAPERQSFDAMRTTLLAIVERGFLQRRRDPDAPAKKKPATAAGKKKSATAKQARKKARG